MMEFSEDELRKAVLKIDLLLRRRQHFWEGPRAIAMLVLAFAAVFAAGGLSSWLFPSRPQVISVHFDAPLTVKLEQ